jgi:hypothetical protein
MYNKPLAASGDSKKRERGYDESITFRVHPVAPLNKEISLTTSRLWFNDWLVSSNNILQGISKHHRVGVGVEFPLLVTAGPEKNVADIGSVIGDNGFVDCVFRAYADHRRLILNPDSLWLLICQGLSLHIQQQPEKFRKQLVNFERKLKLISTIMEYPLNSEDWESIFLDFREQIEARSQAGIVSLITAPFSGTDRATEVAFTLSLMHINRNYFDFFISYLCGIPEITLEGSPQDWEQLEARAEALAKFELGRWLSVLRPVLREFTAASKGKVDRAFWRNILSYRINPAPNCHPLPEKRLLIDGWINYFFPYRVKDLGIEAQTFSPGRPPGMTIDDYPSGYTKLEISGLNCPPATASAGFMSFTVAPEDGAVRPNISWGVYQE